MGTIQEWSRHAVKGVWCQIRFIRSRFQFQCNVRKFDVADIVVLLHVDYREACAQRLHIVEADIADVFDGAPVINLQRQQPVRPGDNVVELQILNLHWTMGRRFRRILIPRRILGFAKGNIRGGDGYQPAAAGHHDVGKDAVADGIVVCPRHLDGRTPFPSSADTILHNNVLCRTRSRELFLHAADDDAVVPATLEIAVTYPNIAATPHVQTIAVRHSGAGGVQTAQASRKQSSLSGKESAQGCIPKRLLAAQTKRWAEGLRVPAPLPGRGSTTARGILRLCPESTCPTGLPWSSPPA